VVSSVHVESIAMLARDSWRFRCLGRANHKLWW